MHQNIRKELYFINSSSSGGFEVLCRCLVKTIFSKDALYEEHLKKGTNKFLKRQILLEAKQNIKGMSLKQTICSLGHKIRSINGHNPIKFQGDGKLGSRGSFN
jgi:hypothetical protein